MSGPFFALALNHKHTDNIIHTLQPNIISTHVTGTFPFNLKCRQELWLPCIGNGQNNNPTWSGSCALFLRAAGGLLGGWSGRTATETTGRRLPPTHQKTLARSSPLTEEDRNRRDHRRLRQSSDGLINESPTHPPVTHHVQTRWGLCTLLWRPGSAD